MAGSGFASKQRVEKLKQQGPNLFQHVGLGTCLVPGGGEENGFTAAPPTLVRRHAILHV